MKHYFIFVFLLMSTNLIAQKDSTAYKKVDFTGDFRFRIEHDWNSQNSKGILREDRSRLRYRFRFGVNYTLDENSMFGGRIRTGNINDQQGPHLTIGGNQGEFGLTQIGFEKLFYQYKKNNLMGWVGKNSIPLKKTNELFWNDNVFPEGIGLKYNLLEKDNKLLNNLSLNAGHFIIRSSNQTFNKDSYLQIIQFDFKLAKNRINIFPGYYFYHQIGNLPDNKHTFNLNYSIFHIGSEIIIAKKTEIRLGLDFYNNLEDYSRLDSIAPNLKNQRKGLVLSLKYGKAKKNGDWLFHLYYANLQKFAIVDYFAQNDWARWDYSSEGASGSRISNFHGVEVRIGYALKENFNLILRSYFVEELVETGSFKENGSRIRIDMNIGF